MSPVDRLVKVTASGATPLLTSLVTFAATLYLWWRFDPASAAYQFEERYAWMPGFGIQYYIALIERGVVIPRRLVIFREPIDQRGEAKNLQEF